MMMMMTVGENLHERLKLTKRAIDLLRYRVHLEMQSNWN